MRRVVSEIINEERCLSDMIAIVDYLQQQNYAVYRSHRKRTLKRLRRRMASRKKRKVS